MQPTSIKEVIRTHATVYFHIQPTEHTEPTTFQGVITEDMQNGYFRVACDDAYPSFDVDVWVDELRLTPAPEAAGAYSWLSMLPPDGRGWEAQQIRKHLSTTQSS